MARVKEQNIYVYYQLLDYLNNFAADKVMTRAKMKVNWKSKNL